MVRDTLMGRDTLKDMPSHEMEVINHVIATSKFRHGNSLVDSNFILMLANHIREQEIVTIDELRHVLFTFTAQCDDSYDESADFIDTVEFSRREIMELLTSSGGSSFEEMLIALKDLSGVIEKDLLEAPGVSLE